MDANNPKDEQIQKVKNISEAVEQLKQTIAKEKLLWDNTFGPTQVNNYLEIQSTTHYVPEIIDAYEKQMEKYMTALAEAQAEKRDTMRRQLVEGAVSQELAHLGEKCATELKVLEETSLALQDISIGGKMLKETNNEKPKPYTDASLSETADEDESDEEWDWNFEDASCEIYN